MHKNQKALYRARRASVATRIGNALFFIKGASDVTRNSDVTYPFRQESSFLYLTGWTHPDAFLIIEGGEHPRSTIFFDTQGERNRLWNGKTPTHGDAVREYGFDDARILATELIPELRRLTRAKEELYCDTQVPLKLADTSLLPHMFKTPLDGHSILAGMRVIKDKTELATMRKAAEVTGNAHRNVMRCALPGMYEYELAAEFAYRVSSAGADPQHAYPSIVATGANACTLHYVKNTAKIKDGDLVLIDAGCEIEGYASDVTRTFPANGLWTDAQRILYEIVLTAQKYAIQAAKHGHTVGDVHTTAMFSIADGLIRQGILRDVDAEIAIKTGSIKQFFPHGTSHWLGLDVHDAGEYVKDRWGIAHRGLVPGMVITVEPGIYIPKNMKNVEARFRGIGIRIEDDVLITENGNEVLSASAPKEMDEIEAVVLGGTP